MIPNFKIIEARGRFVSLASWPKAKIGDSKSHFHSTRRNDFPRALEIVPIFLWIVWREEIAAGCRQNGAALRTRVDPLRLSYVADAETLALSNKIEKFFLYCLNCRLARVVGFRERVRSVVHDAIEVVPLSSRVDEFRRLFVEIVLLLCFDVIQIDFDVVVSI